MERLSYLVFWTLLRLSDASGGGGGGFGFGEGFGGGYGFGGGGLGGGVDGEWASSMNAIQQGVGWIFDKSQEFVNAAARLRGGFERGEASGRAESDYDGDLGSKTWKYIKTQSADGKSGGFALTGTLENGGYSGGGGYSSGGFGYGGDAGFERRAGGNIGNEVRRFEGPVPGRGSGVRGAYDASSGYGGSGQYEGDFGGDSNAGLGGKGTLKYIKSQSADGRSGGFAFSGTLENGGYGGGGGYSSGGFGYGGGAGFERRADGNIGNEVRRFEDPVPGQGSGVSDSHFISGGYGESRRYEGDFGGDSMNGLGGKGTLNYIKSQSADGKSSGFAFTGTLENGGYGGGGGYSSAGFGYGGGAGLGRSAGIDTGNKVGQFEGFVPSRGSGLSRTHGGSDGYGGSGGYEGGLRVSKSSSLGLRGDIGLEYRRSGDSGSGAGVYRKLEDYETAV